MQLSLNFSSILLALTAGLCLAAPQKPSSSIGAAYFISNSNSGNNIVVHEINSNGTVSYSRSISTGGLGGAYGGGTGPDAVRSQDIVVVSGTNLYNTNPGSDTISMFDINPNDPTQLSLVGEPVNSGGDFPTSIAVSSQTGNVCVLNAGTVNGVQCFRATPAGLAKINNSNRSLNITGESTPPANGDATNSVSTILFSPNGSKLVVDVKGLGDGTPGFLAVWDVNGDGSLSQQFTSFPTQNHVGSQNFGMTHLNGREGYVMADSSQGGLVFDFSRGYDLNTYTTENLVTPGQQVTCWSSYASKSNTYFFTDAVGDILTEYSIDDSTLEATVVASHALPAGIAPLDSAVGTFGSNQYLYQIASTGSSIFVLDVQPNGGSSVIQGYNFSQALTNDNIAFNPALSGMAIYAKN